MGINRVASNVQKKLRRNERLSNVSDTESSPCTDCYGRIIRRLSQSKKVAVPSAKSDDGSSLITVTLMDTCAACYATDAIVQSDASMTM